MPQPVSGISLTERIARDGFVFVTGTDFRGELECTGELQDWAEFTDSWNRLEPDTYLAATGRTRRRRHAVYAAKRGGDLVRQPHQPHYQTLDHNRLQGDIDRWFAPIEAHVGDSQSLRTVLRYGLHQFGTLDPTAQAWRVEAHQFRIEARPGKPGEPTPEGIHRDGVDFVLVLLITRENIASGTTSVYNPTGVELGSFTLTAPFDAVLVDDRRVFHGVTAVSPLDERAPSYRDVLVLTYRRVPAANDCDRDDAAQSRPD